MNNRDKDLIKAIEFIKAYCVNIDNIEGCINCPMFINCKNPERQFPYFWRIPEV